MNLLKQPNRLPMLIAAGLVLIGIGATLYLALWNWGRLADLLGDGDTYTGSILAGQPAPDFRLETAKGGEFSLSDFRGYSVMLNFWATWCPPCRAELPLFQSRYEQHFPDLVVLAVNQGESEVEVGNYVNQLNTNFTVLLDPDYEVGALYQVVSLPTTFFIDPNGVVRAVYVGELSAPRLDDHLLLVGVSK